MSLLGIWVGAFLTLCIFSFLYKDNPFFRFAESLFAGVSLGYYIGTESNQTIKPNLIIPLLHDFRGNMDLLIPALIGLNLYTRYIPKVAWLARGSLAVYIGYYVGVNMVQKLHGEVLPQMQSTIIPLTLSHGPLMLLNNLILLVGVLAVLVYFFFSVEHKKAVGAASRLGVWFLMLGFGAAFGYTVMGRVSLLIGRLNFLIVQCFLGTLHRWGEIMRRFLFANVLFAVLGVAVAGARPPLCATFSIVARDTTTGEIGVAVQSHWFSVGSTVPWAEAGVGAVATQSFVEPGYGPKVLTKIRAGMPATFALVQELAQDSLSAVRQVLVIDTKGNAGAHTGEGCMPYCGHHVGRDHVCGGNLLAEDKIWDRMSEAFVAAKGDLGERMLAALDAGQKAGGDSRGMQSAALLVVKMVDPNKPWKNKQVDLRVEDNPQPIDELRRLYEIHHAYVLGDQGDLAYARGYFEKAKQLYDAAVQLQPKNDELIFWRGSMKAGTGDPEGAVADSREAIRLNPRWEALLARLPGSMYPNVGDICKRMGIQRK